MGREGRERRRDRAGWRTDIMTDTQAGRGREKDGGREQDTILWGRKVMHFRTRIEWLVKKKIQIQKLE